MPLHTDKDASFETPEDWVDRTIVAHSAASSKPRDAAPNFVMTREAMREGDTLRAHADRQLLELGRHLKDFDLLESKETTLGGQPAVFLRYTWMGHLGLLEQTVTIVARVFEHGRLATSFTTTAPSQDASKAKPVFEEILKTVRFDGTEAPRTSPSPPRPPLGRSPLSYEPDEHPPTRSVPAPSVPMPGRRKRR
jgi:hypothetical protein